MRSRNILLGGLIVILAIPFIGESCKTAQAKGPHTFTHSWTAPVQDIGDPTSGACVGYMMKFSTKRSDLVNNWDNCQPACFIAPTTTPQEPGTKEVLTWTATVPLGDSIFIGIKAVDAAGNWGALSNIIADWIPDDVPPAQITDLL